jgi:type I site-specific restriction endonuclease
VVISTIQRLYAGLRGEDLAEELDETSLEELSPAAITQAPIVYTSQIPIDTFDVIIVDECHRLIYGVWRQVHRLLRCLHHWPDGHAVEAHARLRPSEPGIAISV